MTIFLTVSALVNIGLGYWLATYLAREKARAGFDMPADVPADTSTELHAAYGEQASSARPVEMPPASPTVPMMPLAMAAAAPAMPTTPPAAPAPVPAAPETAAAADAPELESEVLAGIEEFRNQLAQMKASPDAAESVAASV